MALTDTALRNAKPREKPYKLGDAGGLFLLVQPSGGKLWRLKYRVHGKEKKLALGTYPDVGLAEARRRRDEAKTELAAGLDPSREKVRKRVQAQENAGATFAVVAAEYLAKRNNDGAKAWAAPTAKKNAWLIGLLNQTLGPLPIATIEPLEILASVRKIEARGHHETAQRTMRIASAVFRHAVATARLKSDPTRDLKGALLTSTTRHRAAILDPVKLGELLRAIDGYEGHFMTKFALQVAPHVFLRPGELRKALWREIDLENAVWSVPAERTKMRKAHHVPLSRQVLEVLRRLHALSSRHDGFVFPSIRSHTRSMSENTLNAALRRLGYTSEEVTAHGFRSTASTLLNEALDPKTGKPMWSADAIEKALAHGDKDTVRAAYHRGIHWPERVAMAQWWSDHLDTLRKGAEVVRFPDREAS